MKLNCTKYRNYQACLQLSFLVVMKYLKFLQFISILTRVTYFLVMYFIVLFYQRKRLTKKCNWIPFTIFLQGLREYGSYCEIKTVSFNIEESRDIWRNQYQSGGNSLLQCLEDYLLYGVLDPSTVITSNIEKRFSYIRKVSDKPKHLQLYISG